jgi:branched-chain amino acid aminotransferase
MLLAMGDQILAWPSGTGGFKLGLNYAPGFAAQRAAAALGSSAVVVIAWRDGRRGGQHERFCGV